MKAVVKYDYIMDKDCWRYWMQVDEEGLVWYPYWEEHSQAFEGQTMMHNEARRVLKEKHSTGVYEGVPYQEILVEELGDGELKHMVFVESRGIHLIDMRGKV